MAVQQVAASVQNDGNFCQLDLQDVHFNGPLMRIETFRCSQPNGGYGVTKAGTCAEDLVGEDHLIPTSNRTFRHVFSVEESGHLKVTLEIREIFNEDGSWEARTRDLDPDSESFGQILVASVQPIEEDVYHLRYDILDKPDVEPILITSPLQGPITKLAPGLKDIGLPLEELGVADTKCAVNSLSLYLNWRAVNPEVNAALDDMTQMLQEHPFATWAKNVHVYERFGDFRDKCVHPGTNLTGPHVELASEMVLIRAYRSSLILIGRVFDPEMSRNDILLWASPLSIDPKPGVYSVFLSAHIMNIAAYQLGIDKVHSDYGGIPTKLAPGSRLETGISPIVDSMQANQTLAELAVAFYAPQVVQSPAVKEMPVFA